MNKNVAETTRQGSTLIEVQIGSVCCKRLSWMNRTMAGQELKESGDGREWSLGINQSVPRP